MSSTVDAASMAKNLATYDVQAFQTLYKTQENTYQSQLTALGKVQTALNSFRSAVQSMNSSNSSVVQNSATSSSESNFTASASAKALAGSYQIFVEQIATANQVSASMPSTLTADTEIPATGTLDLTVGSNTLTLDLSTIDSDGDGKTTMAELVKAINNSSDNPGVSATLVRSNGQTHFMLSSTETGAANTISVSASGTGESWFENAFSALNQITEAKDAVIWLGAQNSGLKLTNSSNTFSNVIEGVDVTVTKAQTSGESSLNLKVGADDDATKSQVNKFIEAYNTLMSTLNQYGKSSSDDSERGILANDPTLRSIKAQVNRVVRQTFDGKHLSDIGITISRTGEMELDATKLAKAQKENSNILESMFNGTGNLLDSIEEVTKSYTDSVSGIFKSRETSLQQSIDQLEDKQIVLEERYNMAYKRYLNQFTQMNSLLTQMDKTMSMFSSASTSSSS
ncbi:Flagellar hook-associated protein 2 [Vibrio aerogenes CECT 7868]|uniref:Flagellar hook-associated protein 2 n=1 Tax=Vibrio aerogenes CECT 7868 TaxID=1216006 RepID=A0A1M5YKL7_9VIBR|nr:flagellar filament capping protein FliD [Vibrio aerogenes]SHI12404.1 Flagellar hook-associated protein 2 [Vibrio aerogenes CECT 7868]